MDDGNDDRGIIPACAGSSRGRRLPSSGGWDHPRVCGEQHCRLLHFMTGTGSSPRVRGAADLELAADSEHGIIPACAGSRAASMQATRSRWDHPRVCGEQSMVWPTMPAQPGSSPRVRGAESQTFRMVARRGIIPACAGSRISVISISLSPWDHPRVCGEQDGVWRKKDVYEGSSPRVRGAAATKTARHGGRGIIPACAGSSAAIAEWSRGTRDHPRVCGEQWLKVHAVSVKQGSSPRVRGAGHLLYRNVVERGIIPACAGSRSASARAVASARDHPRVCGEQRDTSSL